MDIAACTSGHTSGCSSELYLLTTAPWCLGIPFLCHLFIYQAFREHSVTSVQLYCPIKMALCIHSLKIQKCEGGHNSFTVVGKSQRPSLSDPFKLGWGKKIEKHICCQRQSPSDVSMQWCSPEGWIVVSIFNRCSDTLLPLKMVEAGAKLS